MKFKWFYIFTAVLINFLLIKTFPTAGGGVELIFYITIPIILIIAGVLTFVDYKIVSSMKNKIIFRGIFVSLIVLLSYFFFPNPEKNSPYDILKILLSNEKLLNNISYQDCFLSDSDPNNFERIVLARRKYRDVILDTFVVVNYKENKNYTLVKRFKIYFKKGMFNCDELKIISIGINKFEFVDILQQDTIVFYYNKSLNYSPEDIDFNFKNKINCNYDIGKLNVEFLCYPFYFHPPEKRYWVYKIYYYFKT